MRKMRKELKVGEKMTFTVEVVESGIDCTDCFFNICCGFSCTPDYRSDGKRVIFKEVKE